MSLCAASSASFACLALYYPSIFSLSPYVSLGPLSVCFLLSFFCTAYYGSGELCYFIPRIFFGRMKTTVNGFSICKQNYDPLEQLLFSEIYGLIWIKLKKSALIYCMSQLWISSVPQYYTCKMHKLIRGMNQY